MDKTADNKRFVKYIAYLQAIGIVLVVFGHSFHEYPDGDYGRSLLIYRMMFSFRMPLFIFVSGFLMVYTMNIRGDKPRSWGQFVLNKVLRLLIPFVVVSAIAFVPRALLSSMADDPIPLDFSFFFSSLFSGGTLVIPFFWFLQASFILLVTIYGLLRLCDMMHISRGAVLIGTTIFLGFLSFLPVKWTSFFYFNEVIRLGVYFAAGATFATFAEKMDRHIKWHSPIVFISLLLLWGASFFWFENTPWIIVCSFIGIAMCISFVRILERHRITVFDHLMGANYMIFLLSWFCNVGTQQVLHHFVEMPWWCFTILSLTGGVYIPWICYRFLIKNVDKPWSKPVAFLLGQTLKNKRPHNKPPTPGPTVKSHSPKPNSNNTH